MTKGTPSRRGGKIVHIICRRCGRHSYHRQKGVCSSCGFGDDCPAARLRVGEAEALRARRTCPGPGPGDARIVRDREPKGSLRPLAVCRSAAPAYDFRRASHARPELQSGSRDGVRAVVVDRQPERAAKAPRPRRRRETAAHGGGGAEKDRLSRAGDEVRADDLVDPVDVEGPRALEHRAGARGRSPERVARGVARDVRLRLHDTDGPTFPRGRHRQERPEQLPGDARLSVGRRTPGRGDVPPAVQRILPRSQSGAPSTATVASPIVIQERYRHRLRPP